MRISDWSSDVCSSDLRARFAAKLGVDEMPVARPAVAPVREQPEFPTVQMAALNTAPEPLTRPSPQYARLAYLMLAQLGACRMLNAVKRNVWISPSNGAILPLQTLLLVMLDRPRTRLNSSP